MGAPFGRLTYPEDRQRSLGQSLNTCHEKVTADMGKPVRRHDVVLRNVGGDEGILFDPVDRKIHVLNATAVVVWQLADGTREVGEIAAEIARRFEPPEGAAVEADVEEVLGHLRYLSLLEAEVSRK